VTYSKQPPEATITRQGAVCSYRMGGRVQRGPGLHDTAPRTEESQIGALGRGTVLLFVPPLL